MEEPVFIGQSLHLRDHVGQRGIVGIGRDTQQHFLCDRRGRSRLQGPHECSGPGIRVESGGPDGVGFFELLPLGGAFAGLSDVVGGLEDLAPGCGQSCGAEGPVDSEQAGLSRAFDLVLFAHGSGVLLVVAGDLLERSVWYAFGQQCGCGADEAVSHPDAGVEEPQRFAWFEGFQPKRHLG